MCKCKSCFSRKLYSLHFFYFFNDLDDNEDDISKLMKKAHDGMMSEVQDLIQKWDTRLRDMSTETTINPRFQEDTVSKF